MEKSETRKNHISFAKYLTIPKTIRFLNLFWGRSMKNELLKGKQKDYAVLHIKLVEIGFITEGKIICLT